MKQFEFFRSFGRPEKQVILQAIFSKFNSTELLNNNVIDSLETLASKPMLHVYWTSCTVRLLLIV